MNTGTRTETKISYARKSKHRLESRDYTEREEGHIIEGCICPAKELGPLPGGCSGK